jgi:hypothetical protein
MASLTQDLEAAMTHFEEVSKPMLGYASTAFSEIKSILVKLLEELHVTATGVAVNAIDAQARHDENDAHLATLDPTTGPETVAQAPEKADDFGNRYS